MGSGSGWGRKGFMGTYLQPPSSYREASKKMELGSSAAWLEDERRWAEAETRNVSEMGMPSCSEDYRAVDQVTCNL